MELRILCRNKIEVGNNVLHLWDVKDMEYQNINDIL